MQNFILAKIFAAVGRRLDGYKTKIGGVGGILLGVLGLVKLVFPDQLPTLPDLGFEASLGSISAGFAVLGIGGKLEKQTKGLAASQPVIDSSLSFSPKDAGK